MDEIRKKLEELYDLLKTIPNECKGVGNEANRRKYMRVKSDVHELLITFNSKVLD